MAPRRKVAAGPEPGFDAIRRAFKADEILASSLVLHVEALPRIARVRAEAEGRDFAERSKIRRLRAAAKANVVDESRVTIDDLRRYFLAKAEELELAKRPLAAASFRELAGRDDPAAVDVDQEQVEEAVRDAERQVERARHEPDYALELAQRLVREVPRNRLAIVDPLPEVLEQLQRREAEDRARAWEIALARGVAPSELHPQPENEIEEELLAQLVTGLQSRAPEWVQ